MMWLVKFMYLDYKRLIKFILALIFLFVAFDFSSKAQNYPAPPKSVQHKLTLSGSSTAINVDANNVISKACRDNMGSANFRITWVNNSASFFNTTGTSYIFSTVCENQLKSLNLPMSRIYFTYYEAGGLHNGLDMLAVVCTRNNIPQNKIIICIEHYQANTILGVPVYQDAINYVKSKGYGFKYWEISNEPQYAWGSGLENPVTYAQHVKDCYAAIKAIDSTMIVGCEICRRSWYTDQVLSNINGQSDFIAGHWYGITNTDQYSTSDLILAENFKDLDYISYENQNILSKTGKPIPQIDTEWRLLADGTVNGVSLTGEWNDKCGNIVGTLHQAVRMIYTVRDGYTLGSNCWHTAGNQPGILVPGGYSQKSVLLDGKTTYLYWLYYYMINNTGDYVVDFNGTAPSYTGSAIHNVDDGSSGNLTYTGPLTPLMVTKSSDGTKLYITVVNGSTTQTVPFTAKISNFTPTTQSAVVITDTDVNQSFYQNDNSRFVKSSVVTYSAGTVSCSLSPLSATIITLQSTGTPPPLPVAPVLSAPTTGAQNQTLTPTLSWNSVEGVVNYTLQVSTSSTFSSTIVNKSGLTSLSYTLSGLQNNTKYYWRVSATNSTGTGPWSTVWDFTTVSAPVVPAAPVLSSPATGSLNVVLTPSLSWNASTGAATYTIQVSTASDFSTTVVNKSGLTTLSYALTGLTDNTKYYWRVSATNATGTSSWSTVWDFTTVQNAIPIPAAPVLSAPATGSSNLSLTPALSWSTSTGAASYTLQVSASSDFSTTVVNNSGLTSLTFVTPGLTYSTKYYWRVSATNTSGTSPWSVTWSFTTLAMPSTEIEQVINLNAGWNIISFNVQPDVTDMMSIVQPLISSGALVKVQDETGNFIVNTEDGWFNNMGNMDVRMGYNIKVNFDTQLTVTGTPAQSNIDIPLSNGFNIIGYPKQRSMDAKTGFQPLINNGSLLKVQDQSGNLILKLSNNNWITRIDSLRPGQGYYVNVNADASVNFGANTQSMVAFSGTSAKDGIYFTKSFTGNPYSSMDFVIRNIKNNDLNLQNGDEIGVFDGSSCVGVLSYNGDNIVGIATGMSDSDTKIVGYNPGDKITMKVWKASQDQVIEPELVFSSNQSNIFSSRGTAVLELKAATTSASVDMKKVKVYPNPFTTQCTFDFTLDKLSTVKIDILDINGRTLAEVLNKDFDQGSYTITWDGKESNGTDVKEGAYLYRFSAGNLVITHPIIRINY